MMNAVYKDIYEAVKKIPKGCVASYGQIATLSGHPYSARTVGRALHVNPEPGVIPCHRVVFKDGRLAPSFAFGGLGVQKAMLEAEGVIIHDGAVDMAIFRWTPLEGE